MIARALVRDAGASGVALAVTGITSARWASITYSGARVVVTTACDANGEARRWLAGLAEAELSPAGHLVADAVVADQREADGRISARIELLSVEDR